MFKFCVTDPTINANYGVVQATNEDTALDAVAGKMGWNSYDEYTAAAANHSGTRTLLAVKVKVSA